MRSGPPFLQLAKRFAGTREPHSRARSIIFGQLATGEAIFRDRSERISMRDSWAFLPSPASAFIAGTRARTSLCIRFETRGSILRLKIRPEAYEENGNEIRVENVYNTWQRSLKMKNFVFIEFCENFISQILLKSRIWPRDAAASLNISNNFLYLGLRRLSTSWPYGNFIDFKGSRVWRLKIRPEVYEENSQVFIHETFNRFF